MRPVRVLLACPAGLLIVLASNLAALGAAVPASVYTGAGTSENPGAGETPESQASGSSGIEASSTYPQTPGTNSYAQVEYYQRNDPSLRARATAVSDEISIEGSLDNIASASAYWSDTLTYSDLGSLTGNRYLKSILVLTGRLTGWSEVSAGINNESFRINTRTGIENPNLAARFIVVPTPEGETPPTRVEITSRTLLPADSDQVTLSMALEVWARANSGVKSSSSDFSGSSLDLISLAIVDENDVLVPGATIASDNGFDYTVLNSVPEPSSAVLIGGALVTLLGRRRSRAPSLPPSSHSAGRLCDADEGKACGICGG